MKKQVAVMMLIILLVSMMSFICNIQPASAAATLDVGPGLTYTTIQAAVNAANPGDTINIGAGVYDEQVVIEKSLTLQGAGDTTIIRPSSASKLTDVYTYPSGFAYYSGATISGIISVKNTVGDGVIVKNLKVDGSNVTGLPSCAQRLAGILYGESAGKIDNVDVNNIKTAGYADRTYGIDLSAAVNTISVEVSNSRITDFARNGIMCNGPKLTVNIHNNIITGPATAIGPEQVPNGVVFMAELGGSASNNVIRSLHYIDPVSSYRSVGIMGFDTLQLGVVFENNEVYDVDDAINPSSGIIIRSNYLHGNGIGVTLEMDASNNQVISNTIEDNTVAGIQVNGVLNPNPEGRDPPVAGNLAHNNIIAGNAVGVLSYDSTQTFDATGNWWGVASPNFSLLISEHIAYSPWLGASVGTSPMTWYTNGKIQDAINAASSGDTIEVVAGTYHEGLFINKPLTLEGATRDTTILDGTGVSSGVGTYYDSGMRIIAPNGVKIRHFTIQNFRIDDPVNAGNPTALFFEPRGFAVATQMEVSDVAIKNNLGTGMWLHQISHNQDVFGISDSTFSDIIIENNNYDDMTEGYGLRLEYASNNVFTNIRVTGHNSIPYGHGIYANHDNGNSFTNIDCNGNYVGIFFYYSSADTLTNSVINANTKGIAFYQTSTSSVHHSDIIGNTQYGVRNVGGSVDAANNYWGTAVAATIVAKIAGDNAAAVTYVPYYVDSAKTTLSNNALPEVYVDSAYTDGNAGIHTFGYDAFNTIQNGVNAVATGGTVNVVAGTYAENLNIAKSVNLLGPNAGIDPNTGTRVAEATITGTVTIASDDVTFDGFSVTNPNGNGLYALDKSELAIKNNVFNAIGTSLATGTSQAIYLKSYSSSTHDITIQNNKISNVGNDATGSNKGIFVGDSTGVESITGLIVKDNSISGILAKTSNKGAYGILINHGANGGQTAGAQILNNKINNLEGLWAHAIGLEGDTPNAIVTGNEISGLVDHKTPSDAVGVFFEANPSAGTVTVQNNRFATSVYWGVANGVTGTIVDASNNWWGHPSGPNHSTSWTYAGADYGPHQGLGAHVGNYVLYKPYITTSFEIQAQAGPSGSISPVGAVSVNYGNDQTFTITPNTGYHVADVLVDEISVGAVTSYTFQDVTVAHSISASFAINTFTITASAGTNGEISPSGDVSVNYGSDQAFTITPSTGYHVVDVLVDGVSQGAITTYAFTNVQAVHTISASFAINTYTITASEGTGGAVSPSKTTTVDSGKNQEYTISSNTGYHIVDVLVDGTSKGAITAYTFNNVQENHAISVTFAINTFTISASAGGGGSISPSGGVPVNYGSDKVFVITANTGYRIAGVLVDGVSVGAVSSYSFTNVQATHTITSYFARPQLSVSISPTSVTMDAGQSQTFTAKASGGSGTYISYQWTLNGDAVSGATASTYTFIPATAGSKTIAVTVTDNEGMQAKSSAITVTVGTSVSTPLTVTGGSASVNHTSTTGVSVTVEGSSIKDGTVVNVYTANFGDAQPTDTGGLQLNVNAVAYYDVQVNSNTNLGPDAMVTVNFTDPAFTEEDNVLSYWNGTSWVTVDSYFIPEHTVCGIFPASALTGTRIVVGKAADVITYAISAQAGNGGSISPSGNLSVNAGSNMTFTITPNSDCQIADVLVDGVSVGAVTSYTLSNVTSDHTITASFTQSGIPLSYIAGVVLVAFVATVLIFLFAVRSRQKKAGKYAGLIHLHHMGQ